MLLGSLFARRLGVVLVALTCGLPSGCRKKTAPPAAQPAAETPSQTGAAPASTGNEPPAWLQHVTASPGTTVLRAVDPHTLSASEVQYGVAPKLSPDVEYRPGVIIMEQGDRAIKAVASDGITWTFDANAPHVNEFQEGKIVFATGRAVGKIMGLKRNGETVTAILGPVQLSDLIRKGRFVMDQEVDDSKMIAYVAPDFPGTADSGLTKTASVDRDPNRVDEAVIVSRVEHGRWVPTSMSQTYGNGLRVVYTRRGRRWVDPHISGAVTTYGLASMRLPQGLPSMPRVPSLPPVSFPPSRALGAPPVVNIGDGQIRLEPVANNSFVGLQYYYYDKSTGLGATSSGMVTLHRPVVRCVLTFSDGGVDSAGINIQGAAGIWLRLDAHSPTTAFANFHVKHWVPVDFSIPLGGPVPLALTFATMFDINSGFSARSSLMVAEGKYDFSGGVWAGRTKSGWSIATPADVKIGENLADNLAGLSVGINSFALSFAIRAIVGVGAFGFNTGVFASVRFGGSLLLAPTTAFPCRQATLDTYIDSGLGYQTPGWVTAAINFFLTPLTGKAIDPVGTIAKGPSQRLFHTLSDAPHGCAGAGSG